LESNGAFTDCQSQHPDLKGDFNNGFTGVQEVSGTIRLYTARTRHIPVAYSVIEETVEGFVEGFFDGASHALNIRQSAISSAIPSKADSSRHSRFGGRGSLC
jgi:hypothetical protein